MSDRGMKKWAPFASLVEHGKALEELKKENEKVDKPHISSDKANKINNIMRSYHGQELEITYYENGHIKTVFGEIEIFPNRKVIVIKNKTITFSNLLDLEDNNF